MPTYKVAFRPRARKAFERLSTALQHQIAKKLVERSENPRVPADRMREMPDAYRPKFRASGLRLVYLVRDNELLILVLSIGARAREEAYKDAIREFLELD